MSSFNRAHRVSCSVAQSERFVQEKLDSGTDVSGSNEYVVCITRNPGYISICIYHTANNDYEISRRCLIRKFDNYRVILELPGSTVAMIRRLFWWEATMNISREAGLNVHSCTFIWRSPPPSWLSHSIKALRFPLQSTPSAGISSSLREPATSVCDCCTSSHNPCRSPQYGRSFELCHHFLECASLPIRKVNPLEWRQPQRLGRCCHVSSLNSTPSPAN